MSDYVPLKYAKALCLCLAFVSCQTMANTLSLDGFFSQALSHSTDNNFFGSSDDAMSLDYTELGLVIQGETPLDTSMALQLLTRRAGNSDDGDLRIDYLFLNKDLYDNQHGRMGFRIGRIKAPFGLYNDTRDVAFTRPGIYLPQSVYADRIRNTNFTHNGLLFYGKHLWDVDTLSWEAGIVRPVVNEDEDLNLMTFPVEGSLEGVESWVSRLSYDWNAGQGRAVISYDRQRYQYNRPEGFDLLLEGTVTLERMAFSSEYRFQHWTLAAEYVPSVIRLRDFGPGLGDNLNFYGIAYYIQTTWQPSAHWEAFVRYDRYHFDRDDKYGYAMEEVLRGSPFPQPAHFRYSIDKTIGLAWFATSDLSFRFELHRINGTSMLALAEIEEETGLVESWDLVSFQLALRF